MGKRMREVLNTLASEGVAVVHHTHNSHLKIFTDHGIFVFAVSPSDHRARLNFRPEMRRRVKGAAQAKTAAAAGMEVAHA